VIATGETVSHYRILEKLSGGREPFIPQPSPARRPALGRLAVIPILSGRATPGAGIALLRVKPPPARATKPTATQPRRESPKRLVF
jgi:hypothetical protein